MATEPMARQLDRKVQFLRAGIIDDGIARQRGPFQPYGSPVLAGKTPVSDGERFRSGEVASTMTDRFVVRYSALTASITGSDRLTCDGVTYGISGKKEIGRRVGFEITAARIDDDLPA